MSPLVVVFRLGVASGEGAFSSVSKMDSTFDVPGLVPPLSRVELGLCL